MFYVGRMWDRIPDDICMPRIAKQLSDRAVAAIKTEGRHPVGGVAGLHLRVTGEGHRGWVLRLQVGEKRTDYGLGPYPEVSLVDAREKARAMRAQINAGEVPVGIRRARKALLVEKTFVRTFESCAEAYLQDKEKEWKNPKHRQQWRSTLSTYVYPQIGQMGVDDIDLQHVLACLEPIWQSKTETATRVRGRIELILDWATVRKYRTKDNVARWKGHLDKVLAAPSKIQKVVHHKRVPYDEISSFYSALKDKKGLAAKALMLLILTCVRSGEVRGAKWSEIDLEKGVWTIPAERMKAGKEHRVALSSAAVELLQALPRIEQSELLFPSPRGKMMSDMTLLAVMRRMGVEAVPHGFRSTFRDWVGDCTSYPSDLAEAALAHTLESKVEAAYRRSDALERRRTMMEDWANFCAKQPSMNRTGFGGG